MNNLLRGAVVIALVACKSSSSSDLGTGASDPCAAAIANAMALSRDDIAKANPKMPTVVPMLTAAMIRHCGDDRWSSDATKCLIEAKLRPQIDKCQGMLSGDQVKKLNDEMLTIVSGGVAAGSSRP